MNKYRKFIVALAGVAAVFGKVAADGSISPQDLLELAVAGSIAYGVFKVPNEQ